MSQLIFKFPLKKKYEQDFAFPKIISLCIN